jgi:hypothetical protein
MIVKLLGLDVFGQSYDSLKLFELNIGWFLKLHPSLPQSHNFVFVCPISIILVPIDASHENTSNDTKIEEIWLP